MDKTHNISLGGIAFLIDDAAFIKLKKYLSDIRISLHNTAGVDEIIADVEYRMAELLRSQMQGREVINVADIDKLIGIMGSPEQYQTDEFLGEEESAGAYSNNYQQNQYSQRTYTGKKKLFRDPDNKTIGGVCSGLGYYLGIDSIWVRLIFLLMPFLDFMFLGISTSFVIIVYIVLWIVVPEAKTTSDKLQMRGEPVNFDSIKDWFGNETNARNNLKDVGDDAKRVLKNSGWLGNVIKTIFKILLGFIVFILFIIALSLIVSFIMVFLGIGAAGFALSDYTHYLFQTPFEEVLSFIFTGLTIIVPVVGLILLAFRLISSRYRVSRVISLGLVALFIIGILGNMVIALNTLKEFQVPIEMSENVEIPLTGDTLTVFQNQELNNSNIRFRNNAFFEKDNRLYLDLDNSLKLRSTDDTIAQFTLQKEAHGRNADIAEENLKQIQYSYNWKNNQLTLDGHFSIPNTAKWRNQQIEPVLYVPNNKVIKLVNVNNVHGPNQSFYEWDDEKSVNYYIFDNQQLKCLTCENEDEEVYLGDEEEENIEIQIENDSDVIEVDTIIIKTNKNDTDTISIN